MYKLKGLIIAVIAALLLTLSGCQSKEINTTHKNNTKNTHQSSLSSDKDTVTTQKADENSNPPSDQTTSGTSDQKNPPQEPKAEQPKSSEPAQPKTTVKMENITAVRIADTQSGWVGGNGWIARTDNGGKDWTVQYQGEQTVHQLFALNQKEVWATFEDVKNSSSPLRLIKSTDGGKHWTSVGRVPNQSFFHFISDNVVFSGNEESVDGGKTWTKLSTPKGVVGDVYFHDKQNGWAVTLNKGQFYVERTTDGGHTWKSVMNRKIASTLTGVVIRSAGPNDAWIECIGDSGMTQTSYSLFHTIDGGAHWQTVIANTTAGGGPAPGFTMNDTKEPHNDGTRPGTLYVVNPNVAFMSGDCPACDLPNSMGWTSNAGKTWTNGTAKLSGYGPSLLAMADAGHGWWITTDNSKPSVMYTTSDGGKHWTKVHIFK